MNWSKFGEKTRKKVNRHECRKRRRKTNFLPKINSFGQFPNPIFSRLVKIELVRCAHRLLNCLISCSFFIASMNSMQPINLVNKSVRNSTKKATSTINCLSGFADFMELHNGIDRVMAYERLGTENRLNFRNRFLAMVK